MTAGLGRYGPYVERNRTYRSLKDPDRIFTVTLEEALELLAKKAGPAVLKDLGTHPESGAPVRVLDGRYGPYVTDGSVNASLPKGADPQEVTLESGLQMLAERGKKARRSRGKGTRARKGSASKAASSKKRPKGRARGSGSREED